MRASWLLAACLLVSAATARAQDLEPRAYVNTPVGLHFFVAGYAYTTGGVTADASVPLDDAAIEFHSEVLAYAYSFGAFGRSGKIDAVLFAAELDGTATLAGQPVERQVSGLGDSRLRVSYNLYGAPALTLEEHAGYRQDLLVGASLQVIVPTGRYNDDKVVNLGSNRWGFKPELGLSKAFGHLTLELDAALTFYTDNNDYLGSSTRKQDSIFALQGHGIYNLHRAVWAAVDLTWYSGGRTTVDGIEKGESLSSLRIGGTVSFAMSRRQSVKLYASTAAITRFGGDFTTAGIAWQYRWGGGV